MRNQRSEIQRLKGVVKGMVQGVGFRPFVYRLAQEHGLRGWVLNSNRGVVMEVEGECEALDQFRAKFEKAKPAQAVIHSVKFTWVGARGYKRFEILRSERTGPKGALIPPDSATCEECLRELFHPGDRRYRYPFINCLECGPRFTILEALPYDREHTVMKRFPLCPECTREYNDPTNRRFDAQAIACPLCGPHLALWDAGGKILAQCEAALQQAVAVIRDGAILALKGLGGFQLLVDATNEEAVRRLRVRKRRKEKPFAVMMSSLAMARADCQVSAIEEQILCSEESPIVLLRRHRDSETAAIAPSVSTNPNLGVMLPYTPLHHLLMEEIGGPIVATSGNLSEEPICIDETEALERLSGIADFYLVHNRPILRPMDDSVVRVVCGRELVLRRSRGYVPRPIHLSTQVVAAICDRPHYSDGLRPPLQLPEILAVGGHLKNCVALSIGSEVLLSQHVGDLSTPQAYSAFVGAAHDLPLLYEVNPAQVACDLHPEYRSMQYGASLGRPLHRVQHHWAHVLACMAENELEPPVLGVAWDGTGLGLDGTIWGGEFLVSKDSPEGFERLAHLRTFPLPGGEEAIRNPCRTAIGVLFEYGAIDSKSSRVLAPVQYLGSTNMKVIRQLLSKGLNSPRTSSAGRLFDAAASLLGLRQQSEFEGQSAMDLEFAIQPGISAFYPFEVTGSAPRILDWKPTIEGLIRDLDAAVSVGTIAAKFHNSLVEMIVTVAKESGRKRVVLSGGCFQNGYLLERTVQRLRESDFQPFWHRSVPPNDGGLALGQILGAANFIKWNRQREMSS